MSEGGRDSLHPYRLRQGVRLRNSSQVGVGLGWSDEIKSEGKMMSFLAGLVMGALIMVIVIGILMSGGNDGKRDR